ncbi:MAG: ABC transporter ATP-binding protein [Prochloraceae cyanobacterium]|nr:ABC transporter ATP-binding protein [Prochloraceae cyanobacterium]
MTEILLKSLTKYYQKNCVVNRLDLKINRGELIALLGPSGCGKTTTLRMLAGFVTPSNGEILLGDRVISSPQKTIPPEKRDMSMIFQSYAIWPHKTVFENVAFGLQLRKIKKQEIAARVSRSLEIVHLEKLAKRYPSELSGGQQQRIALARAIVVEPKIMLFDEPLSNLDASLRNVMRNEIRSIHDRLGLTSIYVTHDREEALVLADRIVVMNSGKIQQVGTPEEIYGRPTSPFVAEFIGRYNVLQGNLLSSGIVDVGKIAFQSKDIAVGLQSGETVALCIPPHAIELDPAADNHHNVNFLPAAIEYQEYLGEYREYTARVENSHISLKIRTQSHLKYQIGQKVTLKIAPEFCRVLPTETSISSRTTKIPNNVTVTVK